jgi:MFS family permease
VATRVPTPLLSLGFLLTIQERDGSYATAGLLWTAFSLAYAICVPITGRLIDRKGPRPVLLGCLSGYVPAFVVLLFALFGHASVAVLVPAAAVLGASTPPAGPLIRGSWPAIVPAERLQSAYALDAVITEATLIGGPLLVSVLLAFGSPEEAVVLGGICMVGGTALVLAAPSIKKWQPDEAGARRRGLGPLTHPGLRVLFLILVFDVLAYGCLIVGITATTTQQHARGASGVLLSVLSAGVVVGGLIFGTRTWPGSKRAQLSILYAVGALILALTGLNLALVVLGALLVAVGMIGGPRDTLLQLAVGETAPAEYRTEAFAWLSTIMWASYGLGTALGGQLVSLSDGKGNFALFATALATGLAAVCALRIRPIPAAKTEVEQRPASPVSASAEPEAEG